MMHIGNEWDALLADEIRKDYYLQLREFLKQEYSIQDLSADGGYFQRTPAYFLQRRARGDSRAGSLPWRRAGARNVLFRPEGHAATALPPEHIQGDQGGAGL